GVRSMHDSFRAMYAIFVVGLTAPGSQFLAPIQFGHTVLTFSSPGTGISLGSIVFAPVTGSIWVMKFWMPASREKRYVPVAASTASSTPGLPIVTTTFVVLPLIDKGTTMRSNTQSRSNGSPA